MCFVAVYITRWQTERVLCVFYACVCVCVCVDMTCVREFDLRGFTQCQGCRSGFFLLDGWVRVRFEFGLVFGLSG